jgi:hypothetical protein
MERDEIRERALRAVSFLEDEDSSTQIADRFAGKYAPAVQWARNEAAVDRAWGALRFYLLARPTMRKPWGLTPDQTERVIAALRQVVEDDSTV